MITHIKLSHSITSISQDKCFEVTMEHRDVRVLSRTAKIERLFRVSAFLAV